jgi:hydroxymethylpyrimidine/phosphomethylpyrimidine kinase
MNINSFNINACKIGAVCSEENIQVISSILKKNELKNIVLDTVFSPTHGKAFINHESIKLFKEKLLPHVDIITPNKDELSLLTGKEILNFEQGIEAALKLAKQYNCSIYIKGGHFEGNTINEALINKNKVVNFGKERLALKYTHGTGCTFSTALTCYLGHGLSLKEACVKASEYVNHMYKKYS